MPTATAADPTGELPEVSGAAGEVRFSAREEFPLEGLARRVLDLLSSVEAVPLAEVGRPEGCGVYAIYYMPGGADGGVYAPLADGSRPIYVGKASPPGSRTGRVWWKPSSRGPVTSLATRLREHAASIAEAEGLELSDFSVRYLLFVNADGSDPVESGADALFGLADDAALVRVAEDVLIRWFRPVWNALGGFGNHAVGGRRAVQAQSEWDVLHPGRSGAADRRVPGRTPEAVAEKVRSLLADHGDWASATAWLPTPPSA